MDRSSNDSLPRSLKSLTASGIILFFLPCFQAPSPAVGTPSLLLESFLWNTFPYKGSFLCSQDPFLVPHNLSLSLVSLPWGKLLGE